MDTRSPTTVDLCPISKFQNFLKIESNQTEQISLHTALSECTVAGIGGNILNFACITLYLYNCLLTKSGAPGPKRTTVKPCNLLILGPSKIVPQIVNSADCECYCMYTARKILRTFQKMAKITDFS